MVWMYTCPSAWVRSLKWAKYRLEVVFFLCMVIICICVLTESEEMPETPFIWGVSNCQPDRLVTRESTLHWVICQVRYFLYKKMILSP